MIAWRGRCERRALGRIALAILVLGAAAGCDEKLPTTPTPSPALSQLSLAEATIPAGATTQAIVTLTGAAPGGGIEVLVSSSDGVAMVPASVAVPGGATTVTFSVRTKLVAADTDATVTAAAGGEKREATLRVQAPIPRPPAFQALEVQPSTFRGGQSAQGTVRLSGPALASGASITIRSSNAIATVPASISIPAGAAAATFTITTRAVSLETNFDLTASLGDQVHSVSIRLTP